MVVFWCRFSGRREGRNEKKMERRVYLDNNATTRLDPLALEAMQPYFLSEYGNASSIHAFGQQARAAVERARFQVAGLLGAKDREIVFTCGGTESDNTAICGVARLFAAGSGHLVTSGIEHPAVLKSCQHLEARGFRVTYLPVGTEGVVRVEDVERALSDDTILISIMQANNEVGTLQPIAEIGRLARRRKILFHSDAVQSVGKIPVDVKQLKVDLLSLSGHKFHGPKGVGALYIRDGVQTEPLMLGGSHERSRRAGTDNVPGIVGLGEACYLASESLDDLKNCVAPLRDRFEQGLLECLPGCVLNGTRDSRTPHTSNVSFDKVEGEALLVALDFKGVAVSTGAACASGSLRPSHVLQAMKLPRNRIQGAIRFSLSRSTTVEDMDYALEKVVETVTQIRSVAVV